MVKFFRLSLSNVRLGTHPERLTDFYASAWQRGDSPMALLMVRLVVAVLALAIMAWSVYSSPVIHWLLFLTNWGLLLIVAMALNGLFISAAAALKIIPEEGEPPWYVTSYWVLFNITVTISLVITLLYWILLFDYDSAASENVLLLETVTHGFNSVLVLVELFASRTPVRFAHIYHPLVCGLWYILFSLIFYFAGGKDPNGNPFIYEILNWSNPGPTTALVVGAIVGLLAVYTAVWGTALARDKLTGYIFRTTSHNLAYVPNRSVPIEFA